MKKRYIRPIVTIYDIDCTEVIAASGSYGGGYVVDQSALGNRSGKGGWASQYENDNNAWGN